MRPIYDVRYRPHMRFSPWVVLSRYQGPRKYFSTRIEAQTYARELERRWAIKYDPLLL